ncbi:hypothetical protein [Agaribacter marinus]|uniref:Uncharacterized protein n=1 Tax=Agaribacter marinus TaxID=1431249 RepID=A0AA37WLW5_9ALTE|nr:hypothetical protein [Agaribacter marinus]GLR73054.1 hypothetical protein GCM10007852_39620 [Agaribacter marinus]
MRVPSYFIPIRAQKTKLPSRPPVSLDKSETDTDVMKQEGVIHAKIDEKREGGDRRKRNQKVLLDTRSGRDRRFDRANPSIDVKA